MEIIIDGYNLIGIEQGMRGNLERSRSRLVQKLALYQQIKSFGVVVVFDGWRSGRAEQVEEKKEGVTIVYSRQGEKADSLIVRIARQKGSGCVVVTSDREVRKAVERFDATAIYSGEFAAILRALDHPFNYNETDRELDEPSKKGNPRRLAKTERRRQEKLKKLRI